MTAQRARVRWHPVDDVGSWFVGRWSLSRRIVSADRLVLATFTGDLEVVRAGPDRLRSEERGTLWHAGGRTEASRTLHYDLHGSTATVRFDHGGHFHELDLRTGRCEVVHPCGADTYRGTVEVHGPDRWHQVWDVVGPTEAYVSTTTATRSPGLPGRRGPRRPAPVRPRRDHTSGTTTAVDGGGRPGRQRWWTPVRRATILRVTALGRGADGRAERVPGTGAESLGVHVLDTMARRLGLRTQPQIFFISSALMVTFLAVLLLFPEQLADTFADGREWIVENLGWLFILGVTSWLIFLLWVATSRYGNIRLGGNDAKPTYSNVSWFTMLFAGGIGTVLMFWGVAEPISHFSDPPRAGVDAFTATAAQDAIGFSIYHLGLHTWTIFTLPGLAFAYFIYRYELPMRVSSVFYPFLGERIHGPIGRTIDIFAILGTLFGVAVSIGLGTLQINAGLNELFGIPDATGSRIAIIATLTAVAVASIVAGLDKGIKRLSNLNIGMAVGLMVFVLLAGSTVFLLRSLIETVGIYLSNIVPLAFWNDTMATYTTEEGWGWQGGWTVFYWAWTVTWSPFIGLFVARISRGRTIREFVLGVLFAPSIFTLVWFAIFGWSAMDFDGIGGSGGSITEAIDAGPEFAMFAFFENLPFTTLLQGIAVVIVAIFFATSSDSASLVIDLLCTGDEDPGPIRQRVFWGTSEGVLAGMLIWLAGDAGLTALEEVITVMGLPIFLLVFAMMFALVKGLRTERFVPGPPRPITPAGPKDLLDEEERAEVVDPSASTRRR